MWNDILKRCYGHEFDIKNINYKQCIVSHEWLFYENFYEWLHSQSNFENIKRLNHSAIDKDIIEKHNKIYSDKYCCLVPDYVNNLFTRRERERGDLPIGVSYHPKNKKLYIAGLSKFGKRCHIGVYDNEVEAFLAYKEEKEKYIKEIANYAFASEGITEKCYEAMLNYKVEITD